MKSSSDAILRPDQAAYLDSLHEASVAALAVIAGSNAAVGKDPLLARMEVRAAERHYPISDPEVACVLSIVARSVRPSLVVELGTNIGYGAIVLARAAGPHAKVITIEAQQDLVEEARGYVEEAGLSARIDVRHGLAIPELEKIEGPIDLLYIDCVKSEYPRYLAIGAPKLSERGVVLADNALLAGQVARDPVPEADRERVDGIRAFNHALTSRPDLCGVVLPIGDGLGFAARVR